MMLKMVYSSRRIIGGVEASIKDLSHQAKSDIRSRISSVLMNPTTQNPQARMERNIMKRLKDRSDIIVCNSDKGSQTVVMDISMYRSKMMDVLTDESTFIPIDEDTRLRTYQDFRKALLKQKRLSQINSEECILFTSRLTTDAYIYGLPKIHKPNVPLRPIIACHRSPSAPLARSVLEKSPPPYLQDMAMFGQTWFSGILVKTHLAHIVLRNNRLWTTFYLDALLPCDTECRQPCCLGRPPSTQSRCMDRSDLFHGQDTTTTSVGRYCDQGAWTYLICSMDKTPPPPQLAGIGAWTDLICSMDKTPLPQLAVGRYCDQGAWTNLICSMGKTPLPQLAGCMDQSDLLHGQDTTTTSVGRYCDQRAWTNLICSMDNTPPPLVSMKLTSTIYKYHLGLEVGNTSLHIDLPTL
ncbi:hypothetical protein LAZ67_21002689 [Cordylochernes scorpioides]|uniref:Uncharacterized protein n=1 Tax=Cordylochernes scorpioides TaxID=51811 RepID=A0ABY6LNU8_9ARAC|nr:hypothetical protein LAZ67_21002689 [Cordylochernes scorpioides]